MRHSRHLALACIALGAIGLSLLLFWQNAPSQDGQTAAPVEGGAGAGGAPAAPAEPERRPGSMPRVLPMRRATQPAEP
ncbi:MAG: hypothetical protein NUV77_11145, partial [Thermoguttaceae bacterium]|nr:hypothetical protein [Thermoguttaceae bacterium]